MSLFQRLQNATFKTTVELAEELAPRPAILDSTSNSSQIKEWFSKVSKRLEEEANCGENSFVLSIM